MERQKNQGLGLTVMVSLFFCWGFIAAANAVLIPVCKDLFALSQTQAQFVDLAFYMAYGLGGLSYFVVSLRAGDPLERIGYRKGLMLGLFMAAAGAFLFFPASRMHAYALLLLGLFCMGLGFSLLQIAANPYVMAMGPAKFEAQRINLAGALNSLGTTIGPLVVNLAVFGVVSVDTPILSFDRLGNTYAVVAILFACLALFFSWFKLPRVKRDDVEMPARLGALQFPQLILGMVAIFLYVGTEVTIPANLADYLEREMGWSTQEATPYIALYWGSLMMGRWMGSVAVLGLPAGLAGLMRLLAPFLAFGLVLAVQLVLGFEVDRLPLMLSFGLYIPVVLLLPYLLGRERPAATLMAMSMAGFACMLVTMLVPGIIGALAAVAGGLACAVLWPCIFALALKGLGQYTNQGAGLLVIMILGGAVLPVVQGVLGDLSGSAAWSYAVPCLGFLGLVLLGWRLHLISRRLKAEN